MDLSPSAVSTGIAAVRASLELGKLLSDRLNRPDIDVADVRSKVHEMLIHMVNAQVALGEAHVEISELRQRLADRTALTELEADLEMVADGQFFVRKTERAANSFVPYCPICWGDGGKLVALVPFGEGQAFTCGIHKSKYYTKAYLEALKAANRSGRQVRSSWIDGHRSGWS